MQLLKDRKRLITGFITVFVLLQPLIDILTSFATRNQMGASLGVYVRSFFMLVIAAYCVLLSKAEKGLRIAVSLYMIGVGGYLLLYLAYFFSIGGFSFAFVNIKEAVKVFYFVFLLLGFYLIYKEHKYTVSDTTLSTVAFMYMTAILLAFITGTSYRSYKHGDGFVGWFYAANEIGAIIAILSPFVLLNSVKGIKKAIAEKKKPLIALYAFLCLETVFCSLFIGTKTVFLSFVLFVVLAASLFLYRKFIVTKDIKLDRQLIEKKAVSALLCVAVFAGFYFISPLRSNLTGQAVINYSPLYMKTGDLNGPALGQDTPDSIWDTEDEPVDSEGRDLYTVWDARKEAWPASVMMLNRVFNNRIIFSVPVSRQFGSAPFIEKLIGVGYMNKENAVYDIEKAIEIDFITIFLRHGIAGFLLFVLPAIYIAVKAIKGIAAKKGEIKRKDSVLICAFSILSAFGISVLAGHVLIAPAVSVYIAIAFTKLCANIDNADERCMVEFIDAKYAKRA